MRYLLDTYIWLWSLLEPDRLTENIRQVLEDAGNEFFTSPITVWEALILAEKGRLDLGSSPNAWIAEALESSPVQEAQLSHAVAIKSRDIELPHQDPADRFIAATAWVHDLVLITADEKLRASNQIKIL